MVFEWFNSLGAEAVVEGGFSFEFVTGRNSGSLMGFVLLYIVTGLGKIGVSISLIGIGLLICISGRVYLCKNCLLLFVTLPVPSSFNDTGYVQVILTQFKGDPIYLDKAHGC